MRWGKTGAVCPHCGGADPYKLSVSELKQFGQWIAGRSSKAVNSLGQTMSTIGAALQSAPEMLHVAIEPGTMVVPRADWVVVNRQPPTLMDIERLTKEIRAGDERLKQLRQILGPAAGNLRKR